ncbi:hypothetical protein COCCADRAFT_31207 [Bipolaris zeicola 26-R-13]|uniref:Uncharacterized protein n=1 Tax=Cochliobolus carbonum (strain 26-R-13) TaxID=930089 RepID=W6XJF0_COCC2|nr:uncharacterized protein COCCADRAFT_31207 [Bipolaris zeicola 26-R-13]EUC27272.1 hypothetical protein COCCADRAFT_31207 [Bipolaris zeicola 26-R-13]
MTSVLFGGWRGGGRRLGSASRVVLASLLHEPCQVVGRAQMRVQGNVQIEEYSLSARAEQLASANRALADGDWREEEKSRRGGRDAASGLDVEGGGLGSVEEMQWTGRAVTGQGEKNECR